MKSKVGMALTVVLLLAVAVGIAFAQSVPQVINYQGRLTDDQGQPLADGSTVDLIFAFYGVESGATPLYLTVLQEDVVVTGGIFNVLIGSGTITPGTESTMAGVYEKHSEVWMGIKADTDQEMVPRTRIASTPYAMKAETCNKVDPGWLTRDSDQDGFFQYQDCNDQDPAVNSDALEICGDGKDNNCRNGDCVLAASYDTPNFAWDVNVANNYAYVANEAAGLQIIDVSVPETPTFAGSFNTSGSAYGVDVNEIEPFVYIADSTAGLRIIYANNPASPTLSGTYNTPGAAYDVFWTYNYVFVADFSSGLQIVNISNYSNPSLAGSYDTPGLAYDVFVSGDYAYVADYDHGLQIIDVSVLSASTLAGSYDTPGWAYGVHVSGNYAYVADYNYGLQIIDVSNPADPTPAGSLQTPAGEAYKVFVSGDYAYVTEHYAGVHIIDVSDPADPRLVATYDNPGYARGVFANGNYVYVADYETLEIIRAMSPP